MEPCDPPEVWLPVFVFSKDRPCQLLCSLASLLRHLKAKAIDISILYKASSKAFSDSYSVVEGLLGSGLYTAQTSQVEFHWMEETETKTLGLLLDEALERVRHRSKAAQSVLLTVDDALWFQDFDATAAMELLREDGRIYSVHAKLCPRIEYAHPNNKFMRVPPFYSKQPALPFQKEKSDGSTSELLIFDRSKGEYDWNYPWELSASFYRLDSVEEVLQKIRAEFGASAADHPNHLEGYGVRLLKQQKLRTANSATHCACSDHPVVAVVTINRVQNLFENPVYDTNGSEMSPEELDKVGNSE